MEFKKRLVVTLYFILLQLSSSVCTISETLERFWATSCEYSSDIEKLFPVGDREGDRRKRSILLEEADFDDPDELLNYLYPLADLTPEDMAVEEQRSSSHSNPLYPWILDLAHLWTAECHSRSEQDDSSDIEEENMEEWSKT